MKKINLDAQRIEFNVPFNKEFNKRIKNAGGRFDGTKKVWWIDIDAEKITNEILKDVYGYEENGELVDVKVTIDFKNSDFEYTDDRNAEFLGRTVVYSVNRDFKKVGNGIQIISGDYEESGGSVKNPAVKFNEDQNFVFIIKDIYKSKVDEYFKNNTNASDFVEIIKQTDEAKLQKLKKRREELSAQITALDIEIYELENT